MNCTSKLSIVRQTCQLERKCKLCPAVIHFADIKGRPHPFDSDGRSHFETCPGADQIRSERRAQATFTHDQTELFSTAADTLYPD